MKKKKPQPKKEWTAADGPPKADGRYMGRKTYNGFEVRGGKFYPSPGNTKTIADIGAEEAGLNNLLHSISEYVSKRLAQTSKQSAEWWKNMRDDIGLDFNTTDAKWEPYNECIVITPKPSDEKPK